MSEASAASTRYHFFYSALFNPDVATKPIISEIRIGKDQARTPNERPKKRIGPTVMTQKTPNAPRIITIA